MWAEYEFHPVVGMKMSGGTFQISGETWGKNYPHDLNPIEGEWPNPSWK